MIVGVPKEVKKDEFRISMLPAGAQLLAGDGHTIMVEKDAGTGSGFSNEDYLRSGAEIVETTNEIFERSEMIVKVKEPQPEEIARLQKDQIVFTYNDKVVPILITTTYSQFQ